MSATLLADDPALTTAPIADREVVRFHDEGFCQVPRLIARTEAQRFRGEALRVANDASRAHYANNPVFTQLVNLWRENEILKALTFHPQILAAVHALARGRRMRLWHDHLLIKRPRNGLASEFHQDEPYWSVARETFTISAWVALNDVPVERGCMSFIPGSHRRRDLRAQDLHIATDLFSIWPDLAYAERVVCPVVAGGATFHQGFTAHRAGANETDEDRVAMSIIWVDADARFNGQGHCVTDDLGLAVGQTLPDHRCPPV